MFTAVAPATTGRPAGSDVCCPARLGYAAFATTCRPADWPGAAAGAEPRSRRGRDSRSAAKDAAPAGRAQAPCQAFCCGGCFAEPGPDLADGDLVVAGGSHGAIAAWSLADGSPAWSVAHHSDAVNALATVDVADGQLLISGGDDQTVRVWNPSNQREI